ncbi:hypothetical protein C8Q70DRAFT_925975 [Cubamyces menziesii]|nr:hypothetical protein C8Q70DRAFT_925975 [Cubamyces menziesii]
MMTTAAMVLYEYIVTLGDEVDLFWKRKISSASIIFFLNRYLTILGYVLDSGTFHVQTDIVSSTQYRACLPLDLLRYFPQAIFSSLRAYAISECNRWIASLVFFLLMGPVAVNAVSRTHTVLRLTIISRSSAIGADFLVVMVTWWKTRKSMKLYKEANIQTSYGSLMLRDGEWYGL